MTTENTEIAIIGVINPVAVFVGVGDDGPTADTEIKRVQDAARKEAEALDISTPAGRKAIASLAHKVAKSKTALDGLGKGLTEDAKKRIKSVDEERKKIRDAFDVLKEEIRKPLTDWEDAEKTRVMHHEKAIEYMTEHPLSLPANTSQEAINLIEVVNAKYHGRDWEEFSVPAEVAYNTSINNLTVIKDNLLKSETEKAELERLRKEDEARQAKERDERIAKEAADKAKADAEEKAAKEKLEAKRLADAEEERIKKEAQDTLDAANAKAAKEKEAADKAKREALEREKQALQEKQEAEERAAKATQDEKDRAAKAKKDEDAATAKREADKKHNAKINNLALDAFLLLPGVSESIAKSVVKAIVSGKVPNVKISY